MIVRKFALNVIIPSFGFLKPWDIVIRKRWRYAILWLFLPTIYLLWLAGRGHALTDTMVTFGLYLLTLTLVYAGIWVGGSIKDALSLPAVSMASAAIESNIDLRRISLVLLAVLFPFWMFASNISRLVREMEGFLYWWVVVPFILIVLIFLLLAWSGRQAGNSSGSWTDFLSVAVAPLFGFLGVRYFRVRKIYLAVVFLLGGWTIIGFLAWVSRIRLIEIEDAMTITVLFVVHGATVLYVGLWLWGIADYVDEVERS